MAMQAEAEGAASSGVEIEATDAEAPASTEISLETFLPTPEAERVAAPAAAPAAPGMRTARVLAVTGRHARIALRGSVAPIDAEIAAEMDPALVADALESGSAVLIEVAEGASPLIVAALQTQRPREIRLKAAVIHLEGEEEVLLRSGSAAVRLRADGEIEIVGSRISAASRGLFRLVGRMLRLN